MKLSLRSERPIFQVAIGFSSLLLFLIQPIMAKAILPTFGGSAGVWVTAMLFFQTMLFAGYLYSFAITRLFSQQGQRVIHGALLLISLAALPVKLRPDLATRGSRSCSILLVLLVHRDFVPLPALGDEPAASHMVLR